MQKPPFLLYINKCSWALLLLGFTFDQQLSNAAVAKKGRENKINCGVGLWRWSTWSHPSISPSPGVSHPGQVTWQLLDPPGAAVLPAAASAPLSILLTFSAGFGSCNFLGNTKASERKWQLSAIHMAAEPEWDFMGQIKEHFSHPGASAGSSRGGFRAMRIFYSGKLELQLPL